MKQFSLRFLLVLMLLLGAIAIPLAYHTHQRWNAPPPYKVAQIPVTYSDVQQVALVLGHLYSIAPQAIDSAGQRPPRENADETSKRIYFDRGTNLIVATGPEPFVQDVRKLIATIDQQASSTAKPVGSPPVGPQSGATQQAALEALFGEQMLEEPSQERK